jgi:ribonuclease J
MKLMINLIKPQYFIPIHGELRHLHQHAILAQEVGILKENIAVIENGHIVELSDAGMEIGERIPGGYVFVDGSRVGEIGPSVVREREALARDGIVLISLNMDPDGRLRDNPEIITRGFIYKHDSAELMDATAQRVSEAVSQANGDIHNEVVQTVRSFLYNETRRRPMVFVTLSWS